jgi:mRNA degradation ribonuclease J1/J2
MHEQDVRRALQIPGHQDGPAAELTIERLTRSLPIVVGKRAATPEGNSVVIVLNGPIQQRIITTVVNGRAQLGTEGNVAATITMDSQTFVQLAGGRLTYDEVRSLITCEGDIELATSVVTQFTMMI